MWFLWPKLGARRRSPTGPCAENIAPRGDGCLGDAAGGPSSSRTPGLAWIRTAQASRANESSSDIKQEPAAGVSGLSEVILEPAELSSTACQRPCVIQKGECHYNHLLSLRSS